uniref:Uncharacterized protein n=1 Tax=Anguilla anguilla TaxID=7936 RepID=A0A0E9TNJ2_ANGAN
MVHFRFLLQPHESFIRILTFFSCIAVVFKWTRINEVHPLVSLY